MRSKQAKLCATAISLALVFSTSYAADGTKASTEAQTMTGKEKATAIGATTGAVAGAVVGGPIGAVVGAGIGGYVGNQGTDANGKVATNTTSNSSRSGTVRSAQMALNNQGYNVSVDGQWGPNTQDAVRRFQAERGIAQTGTLDGTTLSALGVNR
ncbi:MAG: peptidoglycan-binding domain-containing protein [Betaproteobacteria bacterium]